MLAFILNDDINTGMSGNPKTLQEAIKHFSVYENCHNFMVEIRWGGGEVCCPACGNTAVRYIRTRRQWECKAKHPKRRFSLKTGTIMEDSPLPLEKWMAALWMEVNCKNSISSYEAHRALGVTQKTAWFMLHRLRHALHIGSFDKKLSGIVEADETLIGGKAANMHKHVRERKIGKGTGSTGKTVVMGLLARGGEVRTEIMRSMQISAVRANVEKHVESGSQLMTDELHAYKTLTDKYNHAFVNHAIRYVDGIVHCNGLENFWALFKRCVKGTHISIEPFHLQAYLDSETFRFNNRELNDAGRFNASAPGMIGRRLTYKALIGASEDDTTSALI
jgi:transposase-like protein